MERLSQDAAADCLSVEQKALDLNSAGELLAQRPNAAARQRVRDLMYDIRAKEPCKYVMVPYTGGFAMKDIGGSHIEERLLDDGALTNTFDIVKDPIGGGIDAGFYMPSPWSNGGFRWGPFASFALLNLKVNQTFAGGTYLGTTTRWFANAGMKAGFETSFGPFLYGLAGVGAHNMDMNIFFGGPTTTQNTTVPGAIVGGGAEIKPAMLQAFGRPVSVYLQYEHAWWQAAQLNAPAASPLFNYSFRRSDDMITLGFHIELTAAPAAVTPSYPVKALPPK